MRFSAEEVAQLAFAGEPPDAGALSRRWRGILSAAREIVQLLQPEHAGEAVLGAGGDLCVASTNELKALVSDGKLSFHAGRIRGALPTVQA